MLLYAITFRIFVNPLCLDFNFYINDSTTPTVDLGGVYQVSQKGALDQIADRGRV